MKPVIRNSVAGLLLLALVALAFGGALQCGFVRFDDHGFVYENPVVLAGLTKRYDRLHLKIGGCRGLEPEVPGLYPLVWSRRSGPVQGCRQSQSDLQATYPGNDEPFGWAQPAGDC